MIQTSEIPGVSDGALPHHLVIYACDLASNFTELQVLLHSKRIFLPLPNTGWEKYWKVLDCCSLLGMWKESCVIRCIMTPGDNSWMSVIWGFQSLVNSIRLQWSTVLYRRREISFPPTKSYVCQYLACVWWMFSCGAKPVNNCIMSTGWSFCHQRYL